MTLLASTMLFAGHIPDWIRTNLCSFANFRCLSESCPAPAGLSACRLAHVVAQPALY